MSQKKKKRERIKAPLGADAEKLMFQFRLPPSLVQSKRQALLGEELQKRAKERDFPITELLKKHPLVTFYFSFFAKQSFLFFVCGSYFKVTLNDTHTHTLLKGVGLGHSRRLKLHDANLDEKHLTEAAEAILATTTLPSPSFAAHSMEYNTSSPGFLPEPLLSLLSISPSSHPSSTPALCPSHARTKTYMANRTTLLSHFKKIQRLV